ncbi:MAG: FtsX-like permease family protein [Halobacteriaceae archaeon]
MGAETRAATREIDTVGIVRLDAGASPATGEAMAITLLRGTFANGRAVTVAGIPAGTNVTRGLLAHPPNGALWGPANGSVELLGPDGTATFLVRPRQPRGVLPPRWFLAQATALETLGADRQFQLVPTGPSDSGTRGRWTPLVGVAPFFETGIRGVLAAVRLVGTVAGLLVGIVVYSVVRMTVRDRRETIGVLRATGLPARRLMALFGLRAALLTGVGLAVGLALGIVLPNAVVSAAVASGVPTTVRPTVTVAALSQTGPLVAGGLVVGTASGLLAVLPAVRREPLTLFEGVQRPTSDRVPSLLRPRLLRARTVLPTAATLVAVFVIGLLVLSLLGTVGSIVGPERTTVLEAGASQPLASQVDIEAANALRARGVAASPEILSSTVVAGTPVLVRGVNVTAVRRVRPVTLSRGRWMRTAGEAVVGASLARVLEVDIGDRLPLGGATRPAIDIVDVVGIVDGPGLLDDQLYVGLSTARHLAALGPREVSLIRLAAPVETASGPALAVTALRAPETAASNGTVRVEITVRNRGTTTGTRELTITYRDQRRTRRLTLSPGETRTLSVAFDTGSPGAGTISAGTLSRRITIGSERVIRLAPLPARAPPGVALRVSVRTESGAPLQNATVTVGPRTVRTGRNGTVWVQTPPPDRYRLVVQKAGYRTISRPLVVTADAQRALLARVRVSPELPDVFQRPVVTVTLWNPWREPLTRTISVGGPRSSQRRTVAVPLGDRETIEVRLDRAPPGEYAVRVETDAGQLARTTYRVRGDERLGVVLGNEADIGLARSGLGRGVQFLTGNVTVLLASLGTLAVLAALVASLAVFAAAVHARRRAVGIHRASGATPAQIGRLLLGDALRIAVPAVLLAVGVATTVTWLAARAGLLTAFGVTLWPPLTPVVLVGLATAGLGLTLGGALGATVVLIQTSPERLSCGDGAGSGQEVTLVSDRQRQLGVTVAVFPAALGPRLLPTAWSPLPFNPDGIGYAARAARTLASGELVVTATDQVGFTALLALVAAVSGEPAITIAQPMSAIIGATSVLVGVLLARDLARTVGASRRVATLTGGLAGLVLAVEGLYLYRSMPTDEQTAGLLLVPAIVWVAARWLTDPGVGLRSLALLGLLGAALPPLHNLSGLIGAAALTALAAAVVVAQPGEGRGWGALGLVAVAWTYAVGYHLLIADATPLVIVQADRIASVPGLFVAWLVLGAVAAAWLQTTTGRARQVAGLVLVWTVFGLLAVNAARPVYPGTTATPRRLLLALLPLALPMGVAALAAGRALGGVDRVGGPTVIALVAGAGAVGSVGLTAGLEFRYLAMAYRAQLFWHPPVMVLAAVAVLLGLVRGRTQLGRIAGPVGVAVLLLAAGVSAPIAYSGLETLTYAGITTEAEFEATGFAARQFRVWATDDHLARVAGYFDGSGGARGPVAAWLRGGAGPPDCPVLAQASWTTTGAQFHPQPPVRLERSRFDRWMATNSVVYVASGADPVWIVVPRDGIAH